MENTEMYKLQSSDWIKGLITAGLAGLLISLASVIHGVVTSPGFDVFSLDWHEVIRNMVNMGIIGAEGGFAGYIAKNFLSNENGAFLGKVGGTK